MTETPTPDPAATCTVLTDESGGTRLVYELTAPGTVQVEVTLTGDLQPGEPPTEPDGVDAWTAIASAIRAGLPLPNAVTVETPASRYSRVDVRLDERGQVDAWALWGQVSAELKYISGDLWVYEAEVSGWRGWSLLRAHTFVHEPELTDVDREALGGGESR